MVTGDRVYLNQNFLTNSDVAIKKGSAGIVTRMSNTGDKAGVEFDKELVGIISFNNNGTGKQGYCYYVPIGMLALESVRDTYHGFSVGDEVEVIGNINEDSDLHIGVTGKIVEIDEDDEYDINLRINGRLQWCNHADILLYVKSKPSAIVSVENERVLQVGDTVKFVGESDDTSAPRGLIGVVKKVESDDGYSVEFHKFRNGHRCNNNDCEDGKGWYCSRKELEYMPPYKVISTVDFSSAEKAIMAERATGLIYGKAVDDSKVKPILACSLL